MNDTTVAVASDHAGVGLKAEVAGWLKALGYGVLDLGTDGSESVDYPDFADSMAQAIRGGAATRGVLICGSGIGISIAANRHRELRAALVHDVSTARLARQHNDANVMVMGARVIGPDIAKECVTTFFETGFDGGERHARRVAKLS